MADVSEIVLDVAAMSPSDVDTALSARGVGPWEGPVEYGCMVRPEYGHGGPMFRWAISPDGGLWRNGHSLREGGDDTATHDGRDRCSRRLLVRLLAREG